MDVRLEVQLLTIYPIKGALTLSVQLYGVSGQLILARFISAPTIWTRLKTSIAASGPLKK